MEYQHTCTEENAATFLDWIKNSGGVALWNSISLSEPELNWSTPALDKNGKPTPKPTWKVGNQPDAIYTDPATIGVVTYKENRRFHVSLRVSHNGLSLKLSDASNNRLNKALMKAGEGATYRFDYDTQDAVVLVPAKTISLKEWAEVNVAVKIEVIQ
jgi:hypothetical protein